MRASRPWWAYAVVAAAFAALAVGHWLWALAGDGPVLYTVDGLEVRLGTEEWDERLARLEGVLAEVGRDGQGVRTIDLRFRNQVVFTKGGQG